MRLGRPFVVLAVLAALAASTLPTPAVAASVAPLPLSSSATIRITPWGDHTYAPGGAMIVLTNDGDTDLTDVPVAITMPAGFLVTYLTGGVTVGPGRAATITVPSVPAGETAQIQLQGPNGGGTSADWRASASVDGVTLAPVTPCDDDPRVTCASVQLDEAPVTDQRVSVTVPDGVREDGTAEVVFSFRNTGDATTTASIAVIISSSLEILDTSWPLLRPWTAYPDDQQFAWFGGQPLAPGESRELTLTVRVPDPHAVYRAYAFTEVRDARQRTCRLVEDINTYLTMCADLRFVPTPTLDIDVLADDGAQFGDGAATVLVSNTSGFDLSDVAVRVDLPAGFAATSATGGFSALDGDAITARIGSLPDGAERELRIQGAYGITDGSWRASATTSTDRAVVRPVDPCDDDRSAACANVALASSAVVDQRVSIAAPSADARPGDLVDIITTVGNQGATASSGHVTVVVPRGFEVVSASVPASPWAGLPGGGRQASFGGDPLSPGSSRAVTVTLRVPASAAGATRSEHIVYAYGHERSGAPLTCTVETEAGRTEAAACAAVTVAATDAGSGPAQPGTGPSVVPSPSVTPSVVTSPSPSVVPSPSVTPSVVTVPSAEPAVEPAGGTLPATGGEIPLVLGGIALLALAAGGAIMVVRRRDGA